jgi:hypothetical protein
LLARRAGWKRLRLGSPGHAPDCLTAKSNLNEERAFTMTWPSWHHPVTNSLVLCHTARHESASTPTCPLLFHGSPRQAVRLQELKFQMAVRDQIISEQVTRDTQESLAPAASGCWRLLACSASSRGGLPLGLSNN